MPFRSVNRRGSAAYDRDLHRHHLLPRQLASRRCFGRFCADIGPALAMDDFRSNGLLLPATESAVLRTALPLHRGPHPAYSAMVFERVGAIEGCWARHRLADGDLARRVALQRLGALRDDLRLQLIDRRRPLKLNRADPLGSDKDFSELDAMAELLWAATGD